MTDDGAFSDAARAAIYRAADDRCVGCGRTDLTAQHRRARGMGGTSDVAIGHPANGVALCGDGVRGCHGWTEHHPTLGALLGWRLLAGETSAAPFWQRIYGWRAWHIEPDGFPSVVYVDPDDLDRPHLRMAALDAFQRARTPAPSLGLKSQR